MIRQQLTPLRLRNRKKLEGRGSHEVMGETLLRWRQTPEPWKGGHIIRKAGKEEDSVEERVKMLRMEKLHQLTDHWNQMVQGREQTP